MMVLGVKLGRILRKLLLLGIPAYCFFFLHLIHTNNRPYHISWIDPIYVYLLNSLNLASGFMKTGHWDHPGTTAQITGAILLKLNHLIYGAGDIVADVIASPEFYISKMSGWLIFLLSLLMAVLGWSYYRKTGNFLEALLIQISVIVCHYGFYLSDRLIPEYFLICGVSVLIYLIMLYLHYLNTNKKTTRIEWGMALTCAFLLASKFSVFPILIIPLLLYWNLQKIIRFVIILILAFTLFIFPIWTRLEHFYRFIISIIAHDGRYGKGENRIINKETFLDNVITLFSQNLLFTILFVLLIAMLIVILTGRKNYRSLEHRFLLACTLAILMQVIIVAKHFGIHYFLSAEMLVLPAVYVAAKQFQPLINFLKNSIAGQALILCFVAGIAVFNFSSSFFWYGYSHPMEKTKNFIEASGVSARVLVYSIHNPSPEFGLYWASAYTRENEMKYKYAAKAQYPSTYFFNPDRKEFYGWTNNLISTEVIREHRKLLFIDQDVRAKNLKEFLLYNTARIDTSLIFHNSETDESVYLIQSDESPAVNYSYRVTCDMDSIDVVDGNYYSSQEGTVFGGAADRVRDVYRSAPNALYMQYKDQFSFHANLSVKKGRNYRMEIWRYSPKDNGVLVATNHAVPWFYASSTIPAVKEKYWEKMQVCFSIPHNYPDSVVNIYLWNNGGEPVYFDDFEFVEIP